MNEQNNNYEGLGHQQMSSGQTEPSSAYQAAYGAKPVQPTEPVQPAQTQPAQTQPVQAAQPTQPVQPAATEQPAQPQPQPTAAQPAQTQPQPQPQPEPQQSTQPMPGAHPAHAQQSAPVQSGTTAQHNAYTTAPPVGAPVNTTVPPAPAAATPTQPKSSAAKTFLIAFAGALVACILALGIATATNMFGTGGSKVTLGAATNTSTAAVQEEASLSEAVANKCLPSVASITVYSNQAQADNSIYGYLFGYGYNNNDENEPTQSGLGSGVVLTEDGYIITNYHVVEGGKKFEVTVEGETYEAELVGDDSSSDVAVLKVKDGKGFTPIEIGNSDDLTIGEWVMSIGSPFGLEQSVATGIVSATSRSQIMDTASNSMGSTGEATIYPNMIQTDAAINPGNSGGALVDANGKLVGINTLITSYSGNYSGVGFAIPSNYAISLAQDIIEGKTPTHAQLGVTLTTVNSSIAERYGFKVKEGAYISSVANGSGAEKADIKVGDIVTKFDGKKITSASDLMLEVRSKSPDDTVKLTVNRDGEEKEIEVKLGSDESTQKEKAEAQKKQQEEESKSDKRGNNNFFGF